MRVIRKLLRNKQGNAAIEYALISALIAASTIGSMQVVGQALKATFEHASISFSNGASTNSSSGSSGSNDTSGSGSTSGTGSTDSGSSSGTSTSTNDPAPTPTNCKGNGKKACP